MRNFFTPWVIAYIVAWEISSFTDSWAWFFAWGLARILKLLHDFMFDVIRISEEDRHSLVSNNLLGGVVTLGGFMLITGWTVVVFGIAWMLGWDARPI